MLLEDLVNAELKTSFVLYIVQSIIL